MHVWHYRLQVCSGRLDRLILIFLCHSIFHKTNKKIKINKPLIIKSTLNFMCGTDDWSFVQKSWIVDFLFFYFFSSPNVESKHNLKGFLLETLYLQLNYYFKTNKNINEPHYPVLFIPYPLFLFFFKFQG